MLLVLPALTAVTAVVIGVVSVLRPPARILLWGVLALAVVNLAMTPLTSGEWFYQRAEIPAYQEAIISADFRALDELTGRHDSSRRHKMIAIAAGLLVAIAALASVQLRANRDALGARVSVGVAVAAALVGLGSLAALYALNPGA